MTPLQWALVYAGRGWPVFPCHPKTKRPLVKGEADGEGGVKRATTEAAQIEAWWTQWPKAMIGLATGAPSGMFVVDLDAGADAETGEIFAAPDLAASLAAELGCALPPTWTVATPRGGWHLYFRMPAGGHVPNRAGLMRRVDIRGDGGYVIVPPSERADGARYAWLVKPKAADDMPADPPPVLLDCILRRGRWAERIEKLSAERISISERAAAAIRPPDGNSIADIDAEVRKYALAALDAECQAVAGSGQGERNNRLNIAALRLGQLIAAGALGRRLVETALEDAAERAGLVGDDGRRTVLKTIESGLRAGLAHPRDLSDVRAQAAQRPSRRARTSENPPSRSPPRQAADDSERILPNGRDDDPAAAVEDAALADAAGGGRLRGHDAAAGGGDGLNLQLAFFPLTDLGNAERFAARNRDKLKFCPQLGWLWWCGTHWSRTNAFQKVTEAIHETVRAIQDEAAALVAAGRDHAVGQKNKGKKTAEDLLYSEVLRAWGRSSEGAGHMGAIAGKEGGNAAAYLVVDETALDVDPYKINVLNGTLVLDRPRAAAARQPGAPAEDCITFRPHDPADLITKLAPVAYDAAAQCPAYDAFFAEVQPRIAMRRFLHQWGGLALTGDVTEQKFAFFYGKGRNGKSTLIEAWAHLAGDYGRAVPVETFVNDRSRSGSGPSPDLAMLRGVRFAHTTEPEKGVRLSEGLVKLVTGGDQVPARELNMPFFMLRPAFKLTMSGNYRPKIEGGEATHGIWRRVQFVPWDITVDEARIDRKLPDKLRGEASGILNRLLDGLRDWAESGLLPPDEVLEATEAYRQESDPLGRFQESCLMRQPGHREQSSRVYEVYVAWARAAGEREWSARGFSQAMSERGYQIKHSNVNWFLDIALIKSAADFLDNDGRPITLIDIGAAPPSRDDDVRL